jgi:transposase-like protein
MAKRLKRYIKAGVCQKNGKQRWYDRVEKRTFYKAYEKRGYSDIKKEKAIFLAQQGMGYREIGRALKISHVCIYYWIKERGIIMKKKENRGGYRQQKTDK